MKELLSIIAMIIMCFGCAMIQPQPSICEKPEAVNSKICELADKLGTTPEQVDLLIRLAAAGALDASPAEAKAALKYLDTAIAILSGEGATYAVLAEQLNTGMPSLFAVASEEFMGGFMSLDSIIDPFDQKLLKTHFERLRVLVKMHI